eukprot:748062-Pleurochrysis_carterae.AAC.2
MHTLEEVSAVPVCRASVTGWSESTPWPLKSSARSSVSGGGGGSTAWYNGLRFSRPIGPRKSRAADGGAARRWGRIGCERRARRDEYSTLRFADPAHRMAA